MEKINTVSLLRFSLSRSDRFSHFTQFSFISPKRKQFNALINVYSQTTSLFSNGEFSFRTRVYCRIIAAGKAGEFHIFSDNGTTNAGHVLANITIRLWPNSSLFIRLLCGAKLHPRLINEYMYIFLLNFF